MVPFPKMNWKKKTLPAWVTERELWSSGLYSKYFLLCPTFFPLNAQLLLLLENKTKVNILLKKFRKWFWHTKK